MQGSLKRLVVPNKAKLIEFDNDNMKSSSRQGPQRQRKIPQLQMKRTMTENYLYGKDPRPLTEESRPQITLPTPKSREIHDFDFFSPRGIKTPLSTTNRISTAGPLLPLEKGNQSYRQKFRKIFQKTQLDSSRENVHVSQFLFSFKNLDKLPSSDRVELELGNDLLDYKS